MTSSGQKKFRLTTTIVIVESPAKCKKIEEFLGVGYKVIASFGHVRELPSIKNIDIANHFSPQYEIVNDERKVKHIESMRKDISTADDVILATDDDREGEAIAWHICMLFNLQIETTKRIVFHEITEDAIRSAVLHPRIIDMNMVQSQQSRQILDVLVGFTISPLLWKHISKNSENSLSAGRCQTPALRLIYDNHQDIQNTPPKKVYKTIASFTNHRIPFELNYHFDKEDDMLQFLEESVNFQHTYTCSMPRKSYKSVPQPLTTSRIQQLASNEFHFSPKDTMKMCQKLYEGGYITYMRTDSKKYSKDFVNQTTQFIISQYGNEKFIHPNINELINDHDQCIPPQKIKTRKTKTTTSKKDAPIKLAQEAHEAIRPTNILVKTIDGDLEPREKKLYKLIWETTLESCMSPAIYNEVNATFTAPYDMKYSYTAETVDFLGWQVVKYNNDGSYDDKEYTYIQSIKQNTIYDYNNIQCSIILKDKKLHYTEAKLVQLLEECGIGRPSTFSALIDKIQERGYVKKQNIDSEKVECNEYELNENTITETKIIKEFGSEKNKLIIQPIGLIVIEFLINYFNEIFDYTYTQTMENQLDKIAKGEINWTELCATCMQDIGKGSEKLKNEKKLEIQIDANHSYIIGKFGPVIKCMEGRDKDNKEIVSFKGVKPNIDLKMLESGAYKLEDIVEEVPKKVDVIGKFHGEDLSIKRGKYGLYAQWGDKKKSLSCFGNRPIENITYEEVLQILMKTEETTDQPNFSSNIIREITSNISIRKGNYGDYLFFKTSKMKKPVFYKLNGFKGDYKNCHIDILKNWIVDEYKIRI